MQWNTLEKWDRGLQKRTVDQPQWSPLLMGLKIRFYLAQGKLQRGLLLCLKQCHVVIQAALVYYCHTNMYTGSFLWLFWKPLWYFWRRKWPRLNWLVSLYLVTKIQMFPNFVLQYWTSAAWITTWHSLLQRSRPRCNLPCVKGTSGGPRHCIWTPDCPLKLSCYRFYKLQLTSIDSRHPYESIK